mmetsp:Transcript_73672/g.204871  ORF Transcript_73672/g.204871 Transcript_73672/m.204871 type:complete len:122 (+) Transcript_73672:1742-2107(+)
MLLRPALRDGLMGGDGELQAEVVHCTSCHATAPMERLGELVTLPPASKELRSRTRASSRFSDWSRDGASFRSSHVGTARPQAPTQGPGAGAVEDAAADRGESAEMAKLRCRLVGDATPPTS